MSTGLGDEKLWYCPSIDDSPNDISGNGNNGVYTGDMATVSDIGNGGTLAYYSDGTGDTIESSLATKFEPWTMSMSFWYKGGGSTSTTGMLQVRSNVTGFNAQRAWVRGRNASEIDVIWLYNGTSLYTLKFNYGDWYSTSWKHITVVMNQPGGYSTSTGGGSSYSDMNVYLYVDGVFHSESLNQPSMENRGSSEANQLVSDFTVSQSANNGRSQYMDDIRIHDRVLTDAEIAHLATARGVLGSPGGSGPPPVHPLSGFGHPLRRPGVIN